MKYNSSCIKVLILILISLSYSCEKDEFNNFQKAYFNTAPSDKVINFLDKQKEKVAKTDDSFITSYDSGINYEEITNSDEELAVINVNTLLPDSYSRVLLLEVNGVLDNVVVTLSLNDNTDQNVFSGDMLITDLDGNFIKAFKIENDILVSEYLNYDNKSISSKSFNKSINENDGCEDCVFTVCSWCQLDEVVVTAPPPSEYISITILYPIDDGGDGENSNDWNFGGGGGSSNSDNPNNDEDDDDFTSFSNFYNNNFDTYSVLYGIESTTAAEIAMLAALENSGLSLFKGNENFDKWKEIKRNKTNTETVEVDCN